VRIKRFTAKNIRLVIASVRRELGEDAVILSNRVVPDGVEIVAADDYDEKLLQEWKPVPAAGLSASKNPTDRSYRYQKRTQRNIAAVSSGVGQYPARVVPVQDRSALSAGSADTLTYIRQELDDMKGLMEHQLRGLTWGDKVRYNPLQTRLLQYLLEVGFQPELCEQVTNKVPCKGGFDRMRRMALGLLAHRLSVLDGDLVEQGGVVALVGPTGVGKTSTLAKLAARAVLVAGSKQLALITMDNSREGSHAQLQAIGRLLDMSVSIANGAEALDRLLRKLSDKHLVLIDTAGVSQRDARLVQRLQILEVKQVIRSFLVLSATTGNAGLDEIIWQFEQVGLSGCILTKLDEAVLLGGVISAVVEHGLPVACVTDGQGFHENLNIAKKHILISRAIAMALKYQRQRQDQSGRASNVTKSYADRVAMAMAFGRS